MGTRRRRELRRALESLKAAIADAHRATSPTEKRKSLRRIRFRGAILAEALANLIHAKNKDALEIIE